MLGKEKDQKGWKKLDPQSIYFVLKKNKNIYTFKFIIIKIIIML